MDDIEGKMEDELAAGQMEITSATDLIWKNAEQTMFDAMVSFDGRPAKIFSAASYDPEPYGHELFTRGVAGDFGEITPFAAPTPEEKRERMPNLTARQIRLGLLHLGKLAAVNAAIGALPEPDRSEAQIEWDYASEFRRLNHLIVQLIPILGLTDEQVDPVWEEFSKV